MPRRQKKQSKGMTWRQQKHLGGEPEGKTCSSRAYSEAGQRDQGLTWRQRVACHCPETPEWPARGCSVPSSQQTCTKWRPVHAQSCGARDRGQTPVPHISFYSCQENTQRPIIHILFICVTFLAAANPKTIMEQHCQITELLQSLWCGARHTNTPLTDANLELILCGSLNSMQPLRLATTMSNGTKCLFDCSLQHLLTAGWRCVLFKLLAVLDTSSSKSSGHCVI